MSISVNVNVPLVGNTHALDATQIDNWDDVIGLITEESCPFTLTYEDVLYEGFIGKSEDGLMLLVAFADDDIVLPSDMCLIVNCAEAAAPDDCPNVKQVVTDETKISVLGEDGCPIGFITVEDLKAFILEDVPTTLCDLIGGSIPEGNLVAGDRILTTSGDCTLKSILQDDIKCP